MYKRQGNHSWRSISSSSDGSKIFAVVGNGYIYKSSDGGSTWVSLPAAGARNWSSIASSADGVKLVAGVSGGLIYTSIDGGSTWVTQNNSGVKDWKDIASSSDGTKLVGIADYLYISSDSGVTWSQQTSTGSNWISVASSADGSKLIALEYFGNIYTYIDSSLNVTSQPASQISVNSAFLNGNIISTGGNNPTIRGFQYGQTISYGIDVKETGSYGTGPFSKSISNLTCGGVYHFRAYATNTTSTSYGSDMTLTAGACGPVPTLTTQAATSITLVTATLKGTVTSSVSTGIQNPTMRGFQYGTTTNYGAYATENGTFYPGSYSKPILALTCGTLYHYQAYASNTAGYGYGNDMTFTTGACAINGVNTPTLTTQASTAITLTGATLNGKIETTGGINSTIRGFQYGTTTNYGTNTTETGSYAIGNYSKTILALTCGTNYHYRSYATNTTGSGYGNDMTFSTLACTPNGGTVPTVTSPNSTLITATTATLSANITSAGMPATLQSRGFYWGTSPNPTTGLQVAGTTLGSYSLAITGLAPNSLYYYFAFGHNATGDGYSSQGTFTTLAATGINTPTLTTQSASSITVNSAILNGTVVTNGGANPTIRGFQYGLMTSYGNDVTYATSLSNSNGLYSKPISSLSCATTYHYRAYATNSTGTGYGNDMTLMTGGCASDEVKITPTPSPTPVPAVTPSVNNIEIKKLDLSASALLSLGNEEKINKNFQINNQAYPILSHPEVKTLSKVLKIEMTNDDIINLQKYLNTHGYVVSTSGNGSPGSEINYFGVKTRRAVIDFQKANNLKADGKVGPETWFLMK